MPKTEMSRFPIHDDLTAPEESLPILKGASSAAGQLPNFLGVLAGAPAALKAYVRFRAELRHGDAAAPQRRADRARGGRALRLQAGPATAHAHEPPGGARHRRGRARQALGLRRRRARPRCCATCARCSATARTSRSTCTRRRARPAGASSSCWKPSRCCPWNPSRRWSTSPATSRSTARSRRRACCARRDALRADGRHAPNTTRVTPTCHARAARATTRRSSSWASAGRARSSTCCCTAAAALHRDRQRGPGSVRPAAVGAHEGARGARRSSSAT